MLTGHRKRWLAGVAVAGLGLVLGVLVLGSAGPVRIAAGPVHVQETPALVPELFIKPPEAGGPLERHGAVRVATYSVVNPADGNLLTVIPLEGLSWSGRGPGLGFALYHNSATAEWSTSYSTHLDLIGPATVELVADDGRRFEFTKVGGHWYGEAGAHSSLAETGGGWTLTETDQTVLSFDSAGRLGAITDSAGNATTVGRDAEHDDRMSSLTDAGGRVLNFEYEPTTGQIKWVEEDFVLHAQSQARRWGVNFYLYQGEPRLSSVQDPEDHWVRIPNYTTGGLIQKIEDPNGNAFTYAYQDGRLWRVTDPEPFDNQTQKFEYYFAGSSSGSSGGQSSGSSGQPVPPPGNRTVYTDRRGSAWTYVYDGPVDRALVKMTNPLNESVRMNYDADYNTIRYYNALNNCWSYAYDDRGNLLSATDPLGHTVQYAYDALNNVTSVTDAEGNVTQMVYASPVDPTAVTSVTLPPALPGGNPGVITLDYYDAIAATCPECTPEDWTGLLKRVTDANGVETSFEYDAYGQVEYEYEGPAEEPGDWYKVVTISHLDRGGRPYEAGRGGALITNGEPRGGGKRKIGDSICPRSCTVWGMTGWLKWGPCCLCTTASPSGSGDGVSWPDFLGLHGGLEYMYYDNMGNLTSATGGFKDSLTNEDSDVFLAADYDELGRVTRATYESDEATWNQPGGIITREFVYSHNWVNGTFERQGPDGETTYIETDRAGRVTHVSRGGVSANYYYYPTGQLRLVRLGNGAFTRYEYDAAQRLISIQHYAADTSNLLRMDYAYTTRDLIEAITETDDGGAVSVVSFTYDTRSRLLTETRNGEDAYDLTYTYDQGGNRLTKTAVNNEPPLLTETVYHYDLEDPATYQTKSNRLMYYEVFEDGQPVERVDYAYEVDDDPAAGNVIRTVRKPTDDPLYYGTGFTYNKSGELWIVTQKTWELAGGAVVNEQITDITEFRGMGRRRYMSRQRDVNTLLPITESAVWHDYDGDVIYGDYAVDASGDAIGTTAHMPALAQTSQITGETVYYHTDQIGTTRLLTNDVSGVWSQRVHTAFGESISVTGALSTRYGYAGTWGYQEHAALPFLHVGHRYYDPTVGRFLGRDGIGIVGGMNVYGYVGGLPTSTVDPTGHAFWVPLGTVLGRFLVGCAGGALFLTGQGLYAANESYERSNARIARDGKPATVPAFPRRMIYFKKGRYVVKPPFTESGRERRRIPEPWEGGPEDHRPPYWPHN